MNPTGQEGPRGGLFPRKDDLFVIIIIGKIHNRLSSSLREELFLSRSSQSPVFLESYANMHVYEGKNLMSQENLIKICVGDF